MPERCGVTVVGRQLDPDHYRLRDMLTRTNQHFEWVEAGTPEALSLLPAGADLPAVLHDGEVLEGVTPESLARAWDMFQEPTRTEYDLIIVGAGPAGLSAGVYAASDGLRVAVFEEDVPGGQASHTSRIENFVGFKDGVAGSALVRTAGAQVEKFGGELCFFQGVVDAQHTPEEHRFALANGNWYRAPVAIAAPGMLWRTIEVAGVEELRDRGVYYGAGRSEARECEGDPVVVVGAGNSAGQAVMTFAAAGANVKLLMRGDDLRKSMSEYLVRRIERHPLIDVRPMTEVAELHADEHLEAITTKAGERIDCRGLFLCLGGVPRSQWAAGAGVTTDRNGFICTGPDLLARGARAGDWPLERDPLALETSLPGFFAAGDVRSGSIKRVGAAVGEGAMAVALAYRRLEELEAG